MPNPVRDLAGNRYGRLVARVAHVENGRAHWLCVCDCGGEKVVRASSLRQGDARSCGCVRRERAGRLAAERLPSPHRRRAVKESWIANWRSRKYRSDPEWRARIDRDARARQRAYGRQAYGALAAAWMALRDSEKIVKQAEKGKQAK